MTGKVDLSGARAKLKWADTQITILGAEIDAFMAKQIQRLRPHPQNKIAGGVKVYRNGVVPDEIKTATGMIIQAQRDSLDHLVVALARKNRAVKVTEAEFPICDMEERFADKRTRRKIEMLSDIDKAAIIALKPYKGGNNLLYALHWLSNKSKHRDLITAERNAVGASFGLKPGATTGGYVRSLTMYRQKDSANNDVNIIVMDADPQVEFNFSFAVSFREIPEAGSQPVIETLRNFSKLAREIIDAFDV